MTIAMQPIFTKTVTGGAGVAIFNNIPQTFTDLKIVVSQRNGSSNVAEPLAIRFDSNAAVYSNTVLYGDGGSAASSRSNDNAFISYTGGMFINGGNSTSNTFASFEVYVPNYTSNLFKQFTIDAVSENNATTAYASHTAGLYRSTAPIQTVYVQGYTVSMLDGCTVSLYGITKG